MKGYDFHRQKPIGNYIVDFFCNELSLAIEVDGDSHCGNEEKDVKRQKEIEECGIHFLRFEDIHIFHNLDGVLRAIENWIENNSLTHP